MAQKSFISKILAYIPGYAAWRTRFFHWQDLPNLETQDENEINHQAAANLTLATIRDYIRNTSFAQAVLNQLNVNVVGDIGGAMTFATDEDKFNDEASKEWSRWSRNCSFADGLGLNSVLKSVVGGLSMNGGDALLVFDNGCITGWHGTGKVLLFESDQIANAPAQWFKDNYGRRGWTQERGLAYDEYGRMVGVFASSRHGLTEMPTPGPDGKQSFLALIDDTATLDPLLRPWHFIARTWRPNQGRGVSTLTHVLNQLRDLDDLIKAEISAAKLNAHLALMVKDTTSADDIVAAQRALAEAQAGGGTATPTTAAASTKFQMSPVFRDHAAFVRVPNGKDIVAFDSKRPNDSVAEFVTKQQSDIIAAFGLGKEFFTLSPESSYTAYRGAMLMAWQSIRCYQHDLERVCEWAASQWCYWRRTATVNALAVPDDVLADIDLRCEWRWPKMPEVDDAKHQSAIDAAMSNGSMTLRERDGANWKRILEQRAKEREASIAAGEPAYAGDKMVSGGVATATDGAPADGGEKKTEQGEEK